MTKRLSTGVLLVAIVVLAMAVTAQAERPSPREWKGGTDVPGLNLPLFFRASAGTTWIQVHPTGLSPCDPGDVLAGGDLHDPLTQSVEDIWCFEGPDSTWPAGPGGTSQDDWGHWSRNLPPNPKGSRWHITSLDADPDSTLPNGNFMAWCGCDSLGTNPACDDVAFWVFKKGYADEWEESLILDASGQNAQAGGTIEFSLRYDTECNYDYFYLEYIDEATGDWELLPDGFTVPAVFNGVSGNTVQGCEQDADGNYFNTGDKDVNNDPFHGNSTWYHNVTFPIPVSNIGLKLRWRGSSDPAWSDFDGRGDTDGLGAIDNVVLTFASTGNTVTDDFESNSFTGIATSGGVPAFWEFGGGGNTYDGWHLTFDPMYKNKGSTCTFSNDWMWAAKPDGSAIPQSANGFEFFLTSPVIPVTGWGGGVVEFSQYMCMPSDRNDYTNTHVRVFDSAIGGWSLWNDFDGYIIFAGCDFWNVSSTEDLTPFMGATVDSLQMGWEVLDTDSPSDFQWGKHGAVQYLIDNVAFGSFDGSATVFTARGVDIFADTFSRADPAHTPFLQNKEQALWTGIGGTRPFADVDSLSVSITDQDGMDPGQGATVDLWWRADDGHGTPMGSWNSKAMEFAVQDPLRGPGEGTYRAIIGADDGGIEDLEGTPSNGLIWKTGQTVEYYVKAQDQLGNPATFPAAASEVPPSYFEFSVLPFNIKTDGSVDGDITTGQHILLVDDYTRAALDFENSQGFDPSGGAGFGNFTDPIFDQPEDMVERALAMLYGGSETDPHWDKYDVQGAGSSVQCEPRGTSDVGNGLGSYMTDLLDPYYDAIIWLQGTFDEYSYADTTRLELREYLDSGGMLFSTGDQVAFHLGSGGNDADSILGFLSDYMGISFPSSADETTDNKVLNVTGATGSSLDGVKLGIYGECPGIRRTMDRLTLAATAPGSANSVIQVYSEGGANDNGRPSAIKNVRTLSGGTCVHFAYGIEALLSDASRACVIGNVFTGDFGLSVTNAPTCVHDGVDAPIVANSRFGFDLARAAPNPFAQSTSIKFSIPSRTRVTIEVYNILGQKVRTVVDEMLDPNSYVRKWDGRSDEGKVVSSGIYFYRMVAGDFTATRKAVVLR